MTRRKLREYVFKLLFRYDFHPQAEMDSQIGIFIDGLEDVVDENNVRTRPIVEHLQEDEGISPVEEEDVEYVNNKARAVVEHLEEIDALINGSSETWKTTRIAKAELTIIRLAVYEMKYEDSIPVSVAINEAVELAKIYGDENGPAFVNGVLAKLI